MTTIERKPRGFATMTPEQVQEIARQGGLNARNNPNVHRWKAGSEEAREAGRRGGKASKRRAKEV
jgi:general stress protein YciG